MEISLILLYSIAFLALLIASYTDLKTREVPDWLNYSIIFAGIGLRLIFSVYYNNYSYIVEGLTGLALFMTLAFLMFYAGQWGGGDSKMLMALGSLIGLKPDFYNSFMFNFFVNILLVGAFYGLLYSITLAIKNRKAFLKEYHQKINEYKNIHSVILLLLLLIIIIFFNIQDITQKLILISGSVLIIVTFIVWVFVKIVEKVCMLKLVNPRVLTEGDWIAKEVEYKSKVIAGPKDLGVSKEQIKLLTRLYNQKKIGKVVLKVGIPFIPSFLIAFLATLLLGNLLIKLVDFLL